MGGPGLVKSGVCCASGRGSETRRGEQAEGLQTIVGDKNKDEAGARKKMRKAVSN